MREFRRCSFPNGSLQQRFRAIRKCSLSMEELLQRGIPSAGVPRSEPLHPKPGHTASLPQFTRRRGARGGRRGMDVGLSAPSAPPREPGKTSLYPEPSDFIIGNSLFDLGYSFPCFPWFLFRLAIPKALPWALLSCPFEAVIRPLRPCEGRSVHGKTFR